MAYEEATRAIAAQHDSLEALRTRTVALASVGALGFSLLAGQALGKHHVHAWIWLALASFAVLAVSSIRILWPTDFRFRNQVRDLIIEIDQLDGAEALPAQFRSAQRDWAYWANENYDSNQEKLDALTRVYTVGLAGLALEVLFLSLDLFFR
jgi:hypothetical protein